MWLVGYVAMFDINFHVYIASKTLNLTITFLFVAHRPPKYKINITFNIKSRVVQWGNPGRIRSFS